MKMTCNKKQTTLNSVNLQLQHDVRYLIFQSLAKVIKMAIKISKNINAVLRLPSPYCQLKF